MPGVTARSGGGGGKSKALRKPVKITELLPRIAIKEDSYREDFSWRCNVDKRASMKLITSGLLYSESQVEWHAGTIRSKNALESVWKPERWKVG